MENQNTSLKNRDFLINELGLETKNNKSITLRMNNLLYYHLVFKMNVTALI